MTASQVVFKSKTGGPIPIAGIDYPGIGVGVVMENDQKKLFLAKRGPGCRNEIGMWEFPGGGLEFNEILNECVVREMREEYGIEVEILSFLGIYDHIIPMESQHWLAAVFICRIISGNPSIQEDDKCTEIGWFTIDEIETMELTSVSQTNFADYKANFLGQR